MDKILRKGGFALAAGEPVANQLKYAELELAAAQAVLTDLQDGPTVDQRRMAEAQIGVAAAQVKAAQARLDLLMAGAQTQDVAIAKAKVDQAKAEAAQAQAQLDQTQLVSPVDGTVAKVLIDAHQFVGPGVPIVQVADLRSLRVETSDLNENDVARIAVGASAKIRLDALPGVAVTGKVTRIDPKAKDGAGVNFATIIQFDQLPDGLRWGMTANVDIDASVANNATAPATAGVDGQRVSATGKAVPADKTLLSFALPGTIVELHAEVGATVKRGDVIARLDTALLDAEVAKAEAGLALAQASLDRIKAGPRPEQVAEAQSNLAAAQSALAQAAANRDQVKLGATQVELDQARTAVQQAYLAMIDARTKRDVLNSDHERGKATSKQVDDADKLFYIANQNYAAAQLRLSKLLAGADADTLRVAQANLSASSADFNSAQAQVNGLIAGATAEDIAVGEANVAQAQAGLDRAKAARAQAEITAPFDGVIGDVLIRQGQYVNAGTPIVLVGDRAGLRVETTDLNEKDVAGVVIGHKAYVTFDALPGLRVEGVVSKIAPKSSKTTGVNYTVTIDLAQVPDQLRWGMTAFVDIPITP
ncbi:MAG: efflux RND transporter periplasmic adaptor subunit [Anaerolineae bacterium]